LLAALRREALHEDVIGHLLSLGMTLLAVWTLASAQGRVRTLAVGQQEMLMGVSLLSLLCSSNPLFTPQDESSAQGPLAFHDLLLPAPQAGKTVVVLLDARRKFILLERVFLA
jgi:hypothetical protein